MVLVLVGVEGRRHCLGKELVVVGMLVGWHLGLPVI